MAARSSQNEEVMGSRFMLLSLLSIDGRSPSEMMFRVVMWYTDCVSWQIFVHHLTGGVSVPPFIEFQREAVDAV